MTVGNGVRRLDERDDVRALLWFAKAVVLSASDPEQERLNRIRYATTLTRCPRLLWIGGHDGLAYASVFSPDGTRLLSFGDDGTGRVWDSSSGEAIGPVMRDSSPSVGGGNFSPDGRRVILGHGNFLGGTSRARIWDVASGRETAPSLPHDGVVVDAAFSPDGRRVVTASFDNTARVWDASTGTPLTPPMRHAMGLIRASFSPDGHSVLT